MLRVAAILTGISVSPSHFFLDIESLSPVLDLAPPFLDEPDAKGPFTPRGTVRFLLVDGDQRVYREAADEVE